MVRNTILGLRSIPSDIVESGVMSGATSAQLFWQVRIPTAKRQLLLGINQTTMASLSMVIIASIIGGTNDIGWAILSTLRKAQFGESLLAGIVIAIIAMILDRITWGIANREPEISTTEAWYQKYRYWILATIAVMVVAILGNFVSALLEYPEAWVIDLAAPINDSISWIVVNFQAVINAIKQTSLFYVMLPLKIGLMKTVSPFTWGFVWTTFHTVLYFAIVGSIALYVLQKFMLQLRRRFRIGGDFLLYGIDRNALADSGRDHCRSRLSIGRPFVLLRASLPDSHSCSYPDHGKKPCYRFIFAASQSSWRLSVVPL